MRTFRRAGRTTILLLVLIVCTFSQTIKSVSALTHDQQNVYKSGISFFDIDGCSPQGQDATTNTSATGGTLADGVAFDAGMSIDDDGIGSSHNDPNHQSHTSYADGKLNADETNYIALAPGYASAHGLKLGDVAAVQYKGKTAYAVYGDNFMGDQVHGEGSLHLAIALGVTDAAHPGTSTADSGVHYVVYPGTNTQINGSVDQSKIDQIGAQVSGGGTASGTISAASTTTACCATTDGGAATQLSGSAAGDKVFNYFIGKGLNNLQAAALTGNLQQESNFSTTVDNGQGYHGLAQWGGGRWTKLQTKSNYTDLSVQLDYVWEELQGGWKNAYDQLKASSDIAEATFIVVRYYEGAVDSSQPRGVQNYATRLGFANAWLQKANGGSITSDSTVSTSSSSTESSCGSSSGPSPSGVYKNPFHDESNVVTSRIDEGVDYASKAGTKVAVYAMGNGKVTQVAKGNSTFYSPLPNWITYQLSDGPAKGKYVYVAEDCSPLVKVGDTVNTSTHLCDMEPRSIEMGWALDATSQAAAAVHIYNEGDVTAYGVNFNQLLVSLGAPGGFNKNPGGDPTGSLPDGWPRWK